MSYEPLSLSHLTRFENSLDKPLVCDSQGRWKVEYTFIHYIKYLLGYENARIQNIANQFIVFMDSHEKVSKEDQQKIVATAQKINRLVMRPDLTYRIAARSCGEFCEYEKVIEWGAEWKKAQEVIDNRVLTLEDIDNLKTVYRFKDFQECLNDAGIREKFFSWTLRYRLPAEVFIRFPGASKRIVEATLHDALAADRGVNLRCTESDLSLLVEDQGFVSLLEEDKKIRIGEDFVSIKEVFSEYSQRDFKNINYRYFPRVKYAHPAAKEGLSFWKIHQVDKNLLNQEEFWKLLPPVTRLDKHEASIYFQKECDGKQWVISASATRSSQSVAFMGTHGYLEIAVPMEDGIYSVFPISKFPKTYPQNIFDNLRYGFQTFSAELHYPDDNCDYNDREHGRLAVLVTEDQGKEIFYSVRRDWLKEDLVFQLGFYNCSTWVMKKVQKVFPRNDFFSVDLGEMKGTSKILIFLEKHKRIQNTILTGLSWVFRSPKETSGKKGVKTICVLKEKPWTKSKAFFNSSKLFHIHKF